ncbi:hypothetical protein GPECTOR_13g821 [Gonium pectorale]|uniref:Uncharacterized protein n=1 Tax=Gonium pectorale TaxID=33097 RepID=A0A150GNF4_GONPE|nr:hypothetical protein GPECTOR_13g821 [Gonium pectorale]|eukprot:KXZ51334.1 hypothetical protein GPECTOR_13g821 [Gonium pectorale]
MHLMCHDGGLQALVRWGSAMLELAHYRHGEESVDMIKEAITKLKKAIDMDADRTDAFWCLGNAYTSLGFLCPSKPRALENFTEAAKAFKHCHDKEPTNETFKKALEMCDKAPEYYDGIQSHIANAPGGADGPGGRGGAKGATSSVPEWVWDVGGWVLLAGAVTTALLIAKASSTAVKAATA